MIRRRNNKLPEEESGLLNSPHKHTWLDYSSQKGKVFIDAFVFVVSETYFMHWHVICRQQQIICTDMLLWCDLIFFSIKNLQFKTTQFYFVHDWLCSRALFKALENDLKNNFKKPSKLLRKQHIKAMLLKKINVFLCIRLLRAFKDTVC